MKINTLSTVLNIIFIILGGILILLNRNILHFSNESTNSIFGGIVAILWVANIIAIIVVTLIKRNRSIGR